MNYDTFEHRFNKIAELEPELMDEYECVTGGYIEDTLSGLYEGFQKISTVRKDIDASSYIRKALCYSVNNSCDIYDSIKNISDTATSPGRDITSLQRYFNEISRVYDKHHNNYDIEYCPENRNKLIEMNLKTVVSIAKGYQGLGLSLDELISAGNEGLVISFDKYKQDRAKLKDDMLSAIGELPDDCSEHDLMTCIEKYLSYGDIKKKFIKTFAICSDDKVASWKPLSKNEIIKWIKRNVRNATFNSVAFMWIRAYILIEIDNNSRIVKKPKAEIYNDKIQYGAYRKEVTIDIDSPITDDSDTCIGDILNLNNEDPTDLDLSEAYDRYKQGLNLLLDGVKPRDRSVFLKKFGIGLPRPMLPREIAEQEGLSIARISQIFQYVVEKIRENQVKYNIDIDILTDAASKII